MKLNFALFFVLFTIKASAQENWDMYMTTIGDRPASILVDLNCINFAPDPNYPFLVITGPRANNCDAKGMPDKEEIDKLEAILDASSDFLTAVTAKMLVGTLMYNCERVNYYYVKDTGGIRNALHRMYTRNFNNYKYAINIKKEPDWKTYRTFLYPTEENINWMENSKVITKLLEQGDTLSKPHNVQFALFFKNDTGREKFDQYAHDNGYKTERVFTSKITTATFGIIISKTMPVDIGSIEHVTSDLRKEAANHSGTFDSWDAPMAK